MSGVDGTWILNSSTAVRPYQRITICNVSWNKVWLKIKDHKKLLEVVEMFRHFGEYIIPIFR